jgi:hypothetical protein
MAERISDSKREGNDRGSYQLELVGLTDAGDRPNLAVQLLDGANAVLHTQAIKADGSFSIPPAVLKRASRVTIGSADDKGGVQAAASVSYRANEFAAQVKDGTLALAEGIWSRFRFQWVCVSGKVQACWRRPWWYDSIITAATTVRGRVRPQVRGLLTASSAARVSLQELNTPSLNDLIAWPFRCASVCLGSVEVYRRTCCCWPIVYADPRIDDLIRDLERYVERLPKLPPPKRVFPPPPPPPIDPLQTPFFKGGALNELALNATQDLHALRAMPREQAAHYINSRAYLFHRLCSCSSASKVASGTIQPDGSFNICWREALHLLLPNCYEQYAYVVKQTIGGSTTTIYDGLAAGAWYGAGDHPTLSSYNGLAFTCNETGSGDGNAEVFLDLIGDTESHELTTPASTGWDRVAAPDATSGLLFPNVGPEQQPPPQPRRRPRAEVRLHARNARPGGRGALLPRQRLRGRRGRQSDRLALLLRRRPGLGEDRRRRHRSGVARAGGGGRRSQSLSHPVQRRALGRLGAPPRADQHADPGAQRSLPIRR